MKIKSVERWWWFDYISKSSSVFGVVYNIIESSQGAKLVKHVNKSVANDTTQMRWRYAIFSDCFNCIAACKHVFEQSFDVNWDERIMLPNPIRKSIVKKWWKGKCERVKYTTSSWDNSMYEIWCVFFSDATERIWIHKQR